MFLLYNSQLLFILQNKLYGHADDSTFLAVVPTQGVRATVAQTLNRDLSKVN